MSIKPEDFYGQYLPINDLSVRQVVDQVASAISAESGHVFDPSFITSVEESVLVIFQTTDALWSSENIARQALNVFNYHYEGGPVYPNPPVWSPDYNPLQPYVPVPGAERKPLISVTPEPQPTPPARLPSPLAPISPPVTPPVTPPTVPPRQPPETPPQPPAVPPQVTRQPEPTAQPGGAQPPSGLSPEDKKKLDDLNKQLNDLRTQLSDTLKKLDDAQKAAAAAGKPGPGLDMKALAAIIDEAVERWWKHAITESQHQTLDKDAMPEITGDDKQREVTAAFWDFTQAAQKISVNTKDFPVESKWPVTIP